MQWPGPVKDILATCTRRPSHLQATSTRGLENRQGRGCLRAETRGGTHTCCLAAPGCLRGSSIQMASHFWVLSQAGAMEPAGLGRPGGRAPHLCNSTRPRPRGEGRSLGASDVVLRLPPAPGATGALALLARRLAPADVVLRLPSPRRCCDQGGRPSNAVSSATCFAFKLARVLARQKKDAAGSSPLGSHPTSFISPEGGRGQRFRALGSKLPASGWDGLVQVAGRGCTEAGSCKN